MIRDFRLALRQALRRPGFFALATVILSLGISGTSLVFTLVHGIYLRPLPFEASERLVDLDETAPKWQLRYTGIAYPDFHAWRAENRTFEGMAAWQSASFNLLSTDTAERVYGQRVTHDLGSVLRIKAVLGRMFTPEEDQPGAVPVVMLGHELWKTRFGGRTNVVGEVIQLDGVPTTVVGVLPKEGQFPNRSGLWVPLRLSPTDNQGWFLQGIGRLKEHVSPPQAQEDLRRVHTAMIESRPVNATTSPVITSLTRRYLGEGRPLALILSGTVAMVLLVSCANVASLMLARGLSRVKEVSIRFALGAGRMQIVRQVLAECLLMAIGGAVGGVLMTYWVFKWLLPWLPGRMPPWVDLSWDLNVLGFCLFIVLLVTIAAGLWPALQAAGRRTGTSRRLTLDTRPGTGRAPHRSLNVLVTGEVACALLLLVTGSLLLRSFQRLQSTDPGFRPDHLLVYRLSLPEGQYAEAPRRLQFFADHLEQLRALPGVTAASACTAPPLGGHWGRFLVAEGAPPKRAEEADPVILTRVVYPEYFATLGIELVAGRPLHEEDGRVAGVPVVVVNDILAQQFWPGREAVGKRVRFSHEGAPWMEVVGVVKDVRHYGLSEPMRPGIYLPVHQDPQLSMALVVRTAQEPGKMVSVIRTLLKSTHPDIPMHDVNTLPDQLKESLWVWRFGCWTAAVFAAVALLLAIGGLYGVVSYATAQRTSEIGIRMALGAQRLDVQTLVLREAARLVIFGTGIGWGLSVILSPLLRWIAPGIPSDDWATLLLMPLLLAGVTLMAAWIPARRASRVSPLVALRWE